MRLIKVGAAAVNQTPLDWPGNKRHILDAIESAGRAGVHILCLPELCICGYGCEDAFYSAGLRRQARRTLMEILPATKGIVVTLGLPVMYRNSLFNTICVVADGAIRGFVAKQHLAGEGLHYEPRWFKPWPVDIRTDIELDGATYPIGDLWFDIRGIRVGLEICEDAWVVNRPGRDLADKSIDVILNPSASHFAFGRAGIRERLVLDSSRAFAATYVYANLLGNESGRAIYDGGAMIASNGRMIAATRRFSFADHVLAHATADIDATRMRRSKAEIARIKPERDPACIAIDLNLECGPDEDPASTPPADDTASMPREEEFHRTIALALFDYMRKSRSRGFVVSLSGGADSSATACLVYLMTRLGCADLGIDGFKRKLDYMTLEGSEPAALVRRLLTTVYQATAHSSDTTRSAARTVAEAVGANHLEFDVEQLSRGYVDMVENAIGRELSWENDDVTLQNIQARVRAPGAWMLANLHNALLLATSNRSEAAVGYATMDGDTCGGLSPIAGINKAFLRRWLRWLEKQGPEGIGPIPALSAVNSQQPTAELRPQASGQTDEDDLMPYELLDAIEDAAIGEKNTPVEVFRLIRSRFSQYPADRLVAWIERFFQLWCRNQWKRERYAPSFHVDDKNLDPKTWCRFPILSGGFEVELAELRAMANGGQ